MFEFVFHEGISELIRPCVNHVGSGVSLHYIFTFENEHEKSKFSNNYLLENKVQSNYFSKLNRKFNIGRYITRKKKKVFQKVLGQKTAERNTKPRFKIWAFD